MKNIRTQTSIIIVLAALLVIVSAVWAYKYFFTNKTRSASTTVLFERETNMNRAPAVTNSAPVTPTNTNDPTVDIRPNIETSPSGQLAVKWLSDAFLVQEKVINDLYGITVSAVPYYQAPQLYKVGTVFGDIYPGNDLYYASVTDPECDGGPGCEALHCLFISIPAKNKIVIIDKYSNVDLSKLDRNKIPSIFKIAKNNPNLTIADLSAPEKIDLGNNYSATLSDPIRGLPYSDTSVKLVGKTADGRDVYDHAILPQGFYTYNGKMNDLALRLNDGEYLRYSLQLPFYPDNRIPQITWNDGTKNSTDYSPHVVTGCGLSTGLDTVGDISDADLIADGKTSNNDLVFKYKDKNNLDLKNTYATWYAWNGNGNMQNYTDTGKPSYDEFLKMRPVLIWKDPLGRYIRWLRSDFEPMGECGKPVVYLYPTQTEKVAVKLGSNITVTKSEPTYAKGWNVTAKPNGTLTTADGQTFPYLYWDGNGATYPGQTTGFVVARKDVEATFKSKLAQLGLNAKEISDFNDFWLPIVSKSPFALISFVPQAEWSKAAPLSISPAPDTVIRVFMDWKPLSVPIDVAPETLPPTPQRTGFTAVEWGGILYR